MQTNEILSYFQSLPDILNKEETLKRQKFGSQNFKNFTQTYFLHHIQTPETSFFRNEFYKNSENLCKNERNLLIKAYRGAAKTTLISRLFVLYLTLAKSQKQNIIIISATISLSKKTLDFIKDELETNALLKKDFNIKIGEKWSEEEIIFYKDKTPFKISAYGAGKKIRGENWRGHRPDLIICDDLENDENIRTKAQRDKIYNWFEKAVMKLPARGDEFYNIIVVGTTLHHDSLLKRLQARSDFLTLNYPLVRNFPSNADEPQNWNLNEFILDDTTLNKERFKNEFISSRAAFMSEYQNEPLSSDEALFFGYQTYAQRPICDAYYIGIDPALGKNRGDYFGVAILGKTKENYYLQARGYKIKPDKMIQKIKDFYVELLKFNRPIKIAVETIAFQEFFKDELKKAFLNLGILPSICELKNSVAKELRIDTLAPLISSGDILIDSDSLLLLDELDTYPKSAHDDLLDASEMALRIANNSAMADYNALNRLTKKNKELIKTIKERYL